MLGALCAAVVVVALLVTLVPLALADFPSFPDVPDAHPYHHAVVCLASHGIISGYGSGYFGPDDNVTRQQFAKMIVLTGGYPVTEADVCPFADVPGSGPATLFPDNYIAVCAANGVTTGRTATRFDPYSEITRHQVVSMVVRAADGLRPGLLVAPPEGWQSAGIWGRDAIHGVNAARAEYNGLLAGLDLETLSPSSNMTRGEVAQVLHSLLIALTPSTTTTERATTTTTGGATSSTTSTTEPCG